MQSNVEELGNVGGGGSLDSRTTAGALREARSVAGVEGETVPKVELARKG